MEFVSGHVEEGLKAEAEVKQREEAIAIEKERKNNKQEDTFGGAILLIGNGINVFHILASRPLCFVCTFSSLANSFLV